MNIALNGNDEAKWYWACKSYSAKECETKTVGYHVIKEEGNHKVLAFKRLVDLDEQYPPEGVVALKNPEIIARLDKIDGDNCGFHDYQEPPKVEKEEDILSVFDK